MNKLMELNAAKQKQVNKVLNVMKKDIDVGKNGSMKDEPEQRIKQLMHKTVTQRFRDVLRTSQSIQTEFKNAVQNRVKKQIRLADKNLTEEEVNDIARDPEAVQQLMQRQIVGQKVHSKVANTVNDIQKKYEAIKKLEESVNELFELFQELAQLIQM